MTFNPVDVADNLKKYGGYIPGIRPGKKTADYIDFVLSRITFGGAIYLAAICVLPTIITNEFNVQFYFGANGISPNVRRMRGLGVMSRSSSAAVPLRGRGMIGPPR